MEERSWGSSGEESRLKRENSAFVVGWKATLYRCLGPGDLKPDFQGCPSLKPRPTRLTTADTVATGEGSWPPRSFSTLADLRTRLARPLLDDGLEAAKGTSTRCGENFPHLDDRPVRGIVSLTVSGDPEPPLILVVDDSRDTRELYELSLRLEGYRVDTANDGREGVQKALRLRPALIIMDMQMPNVAAAPGVG